MHCNSPFSSFCSSVVDNLRSTGLDLPEMLALEPFSSMPVALPLTESFLAALLSGTSNCCPGYMNELFRRLRCVNSEGVVSKRAATEVKVSRFPTVYVLVGMVGNDDFLRSSRNSWRWIEVGGYTKSHRS